MPWHKIIQYVHQEFPVKCAVLLISQSPFIASTSLVVDNSKICGFIIISFAFHPCYERQTKQSLYVFYILFPNPRECTVSQPNFCVMEHFFKALQLDILWPTLPETVTNLLKKYTQITTHPAFHMHVL